MKCVENVKGVSKWYIGCLGKKIKSCFVFGNHQITNYEIHSGHHLRRLSSKCKGVYKSLDDMPGPKPVLPLVGTSWIYSLVGPYTKTEQLISAREEMLVKYGSIYKEHLGGSVIVNLHAPKDIENVMRNQGRIPTRVCNEANICLRKQRPDLYKTVGLVDSTGEEWYDLRHKVAPSILKPSSVSVFVETISALADSFVKTIYHGKDKNTQEIADVRQYLFPYGLEAIWRCSLGFELGALHSAPPEETKKLIELSMDLFHSFAALSLSRPYWKLWPTPTFKKFCNSEEAIFKIVSQYTNSIIEKTSKGTGGNPGDTSETLLKRFLLTKDFDVRDINTVIMDFIAAGIPTTSYFLSLLLHKLGQEKEIQERLQKELDSVIPHKTTTITEAILKSTPFLNAVIQEGFRLTTIIPALMRILPEDIICGEYRIPAYTPIICQTRAAGVSETYFYSPKKFIPDRWLRSKRDEPVSSKMLEYQAEARANHFLVLPFGFGPRMCVGKRLAEKEIAILLAKIFKNFKIVSEGELELENYFIIGPKNEVPIKFIDR